LFFQNNEEKLGMHSCKSFSEMQFWIEGRIGALSPANQKIYTISNEKTFFDPPNPKPKKIPKKREHLKKHSYYRQLPPRTGGTTSLTGLALGFWAPAYKKFSITTGATTSDATVCQFSV